MARLSSEILGLSYQGDAVWVFHVICFRRYQRTAHDFRVSVFQLVKVEPIMLKSSEHDSLRLKLNSFLFGIHTYLLGVRINCLSLKSRYLLMCDRKM